MSKHTTFSPFYTGAIELIISYEIIIYAGKLQLAVVKFCSPENLKIITFNIFLGVRCLLDELVFVVETAGLNFE